MNIALVYPPMSSSFSTPPLSLPTLKAYLREQGIESVEIRDLNIEFLNYLLQDWDYVSPIIAKQLRQRLKRNPCVDSLPQQLYIYLPIISQLATKKDYHHSEPLGIKLLQEVINAYYVPDLLFESNFLRCSYSELSKRLDEHLYDPILERFISLYPLNRPDLLGFSLLGESQLPYAVLLSRLFRSKYPDLKMVVGGAYITEILIRPLPDSAFFQDFDYLVAQEGESAVISIIQSLMSGQAIRHPNVFAKDNKDLRSLHIEPIDSLPTPDFDGLDFDLYFTPDLNLPMYSSKGCSWGRCKFCSQNTLTFREKPMKCFVAELQNVIDQTGVTHFQLTDENITPNRLRELSQEILRMGLDLRWFIQIRLDKRLDYELLNLMKQAGCYAIEFGLESGSQTMLRKIQKGINLKTVEQILQDCAQLDYSIILNCIVGFPDETPDLAEQTISFLNSIISQFPRLKLSCNTQTLKIYTTARYATLHEVVFEPYPLSTVAEWQGPTWVNEFRHRFRDHIVFTGQPTAAFTSQEQVKDIANVPRISLRKSCCVIENVEYDFSSHRLSSTPLNYAVIPSGSSKLKVFSVNSTMVSLLRELTIQESELQVLRNRFIGCYKGFDLSAVATAFEEGLLCLHEIGALTIC